MIYLHYYETGEEFSEVYDGSGYTEPWTSLTVEGHEVDYNKPRTYSITVTYVTRMDTGATVESTETGEIGDPIEFTVGSAPAPWDSGHTFIGWSTHEWPTSAQLNDILEPGDTMESDEDITLYAVYEIVFQTLIDEGYVQINAVPETLAYGSHSMFLRPNGYAKELVSDFDEVFASASGKLVSTSGVVGEGTVPNAFAWNNTEHWLTDDEVYELYNNVQLAHGLCSYQFLALDWSDKGSATIKYTQANNWPAGICTFGPNAPRVLNIVFNNGRLGFMNMTYGNRNAGEGCGSEIINFSNSSGGEVRVQRGNSGNNAGFTAAFEGCSNLKEIHGLRFDVDGYGNRVTYWSFVFDGCFSLEEIPISDFSANITPANLTQTFCRCQSLVRIEPDLIVSATTDTTATFCECSALTEVHLIGINAAVNVRGGGGDFAQDSAYTWDLSYTKITQACADEMITNMVPFDPNSVQDYVYKGINFPTTVSLSAAQKSLLRANGWIPYIDGVEQQ